MADLTTTSLDSLQSHEHQQLLNEIDNLRAYGISDFVALPQLVVCGDQSSGKSSVLEAITEVPFPRKDNLCTRFATEIVLRRSSTPKATVKILPATTRSDTERQELTRFNKSINDFTEIPALVEAATAAMGINQTSSAFSKDVLSVEISGPNRPQLTIVDLPGLIHSENKAQTRADVELVAELCASYIENPRTIILAVVTAKNDYANQIILKRARDADPGGKRTLGIITKPDTLPAGSESEGDFVSLAKNEDIVFRLGWHVVKNRGYETRDATFAERNKAEEEFFNQGVWKDLPRASVGIKSLRSRLSKLLLDHIKHELPKVFQEVKAKLKECEEMLAKMGESRTTFEEQRLFLSKLSQAFYELCKAAVAGSYEEKFFGDALSDEGYEKRLRAVVQNFNIVFSKTMKEKGHRKHIVEEGEDVDEDESSAESSLDDTPEKITRTKALDWVKAILSRSRGRELPGTFNPLLIGELFWDQAKRWENLAQDHIDEIWESCQRFVQKALSELTSNEFFDSLCTVYLDNIMEARIETAKKELKRLLVDQRRHAMTYNHYYIDIVQKSREARRRKACRESLSSMLGYGADELPDFVEVNTNTLLDSVVSQSTETDMDMYACLELLDCMLAYYKVALKTFIDNVAAQVVERRIVGELWDVFSPVSIATMDAKTVAEIAAESPEDQKLREELELQRDRLRKGMRVCRRALTGFSAANPLGGDRRGSTASGSKGKGRTVEITNGNGAKVNGEPPVDPESDPED